MNATLRTSYVPVKVHTKHAQPCKEISVPATTAPRKRPVNLSINARTLERAKELGMNLSKTVDAFQGEEVKRRYWEKWRDDNKGAFAANNERVRREGLPLAKYRSFGKSLGDGREQS